MSAKFNHLHVHSHYSLLSALPRIDELVNKAKECEMGALALTDNGNLYAAIEFYKAAKKEGIKPIIGIDAYVAARTRKDKQAGIDNRRTRLVLLAENEIGYKNLIKLSTDSNLEGFYYKPRVDRELLEKYKNGLIAIIPSFSGNVAQAIRSNDREKAKEFIAVYRNIFGPDNLYLEITHHPEIENHESTMKKLAAFAEDEKIPLVAAHDVYYMNPDDKKARDTLVAVNNTSDFSDRENNETDFSFTDQKQMTEWFKAMPEALENTAKIADRVNLELQLGKWVFPDFKLSSGATPDDELRRVTFEGFEKRGVQKTAEALKRVEYELEVIKKKGYSPYFLVVSDLLRHAKEAGILSTTRGSAGGSMVSYLSYITTVNPMAYGLPFERFLNPDRPSAPDIDMDIADNRRDDMIAYAKSKYGDDRVAQIGTFGTMMARGSVRDVARALGFEYALGDRIAKLIPMGSQGFPMTIDRAFEIVPELQQIYKAEAEVREIIDTAKKIEGCARHVSVHAAGVVIAPSPLTDFTPLQFDPKGEGKVITQYDMYSIEEAGLLKFDFLGIKNLSILSDAIDRVQKIDGVKVDLDNLPLDDKKTFDMLARGETIGLFQLNGSGMTRYLKDLRPSSIHDINAMVALYRPGPMESIPQYIERKYNPRLVQYLDPRMKEILSASYGVLTYQDDVLLIAIKLAGYSWIEADKLRKAMGKKIPAEMEAQREKLIAGCIKNGMSKEKADKLWSLIEPFAAYGFNKCVTRDTVVVNTENGKRSSVEALYKQNKIISLSSVSQAGKISSRKIHAVLQNGIKTVYKLKTKTGREIRATANHPVCTFSGWKNLNELTPGERIAVPRIIRTGALKFNPNDLKYKAPVLGYLIAEGNLCHPHGIYFYSTKKDEIADFIRCAAKFDNAAFKINRSKSAASVYCGQKNPQKGNQLRKWIAELGLINKKATEKKMPESVFSWPLNDQAVLIGKMWQGDGCVDIKGVQLYYATSSIVLVKDLQHLLLRFGIISVIHKKQFAYRGDFKTGYTLVISHRDNILKFAERIGTHLIGDKRKTLSKLLKYCSLTSEVAARGTKDIIPKDVLAIIRQEMLVKQYSVSIMSQKTGLSERLFNFDGRKIGYEPAVIRKIAEVLTSDTLANIANADIYWDEVVSVTPNGKEMTYDLTVPPDHNFIANDIVVHNSHAASYGRVAYQTAYMKANFPAIYMSAVLTADSGDVEKIGETITECKRMGIPVLPPSINESFSAFTVVKAGELRTENGEQKVQTGDKIRFGLMTIKNFGEGISHSIIQERKNGGKFKTLSDFLSRVKDRNLNKKSLEALIKAGALDEFAERGAMLHNMERLLAYSKESNAASKDQSSLFGSLPGAAELENVPLEAAPAASASEKLAWEKELLGLYISGHPLDKFRSLFEKREINIRKVREEMREGMIAVVGGIIEEARPVITKGGDNMAFLKLADLSGSLEVVVFPRTYNEFKNILTAESCIAVKGRVSHRNGEVSIVADKVKQLVLPASVSTPESKQTILVKT